MHGHTRKQTQEHGLASILSLPKVCTHGSLWSWLMACTAPHNSICQIFYHLNLQLVQAEPCRCAYIHKLTQSSDLYTSKGSCNAILKYEAR